MKKRWGFVAALLLAFSLALSGCSGSSGDASSSERTEPSQEAADHVADLIDGIYIQNYREDTDQNCKEAREAWEALTDEEKELVQGENATPDYFGRDTGDASLDDPLNENSIGQNEILVVSFGTSFNDSRVEDIKGVEDAIAAAYPDWSVRRAFTSQIIINHILARDDESIDNVGQAIARAVNNGVKNLVVQPTHLITGSEYNELMEMVASKEDQFDSLSVAEPLLGEVGDSADAVNADKETVAKAVTAAAAQTAGYQDVAEAEKDGTAFVLLGHGSSHTAKITYTQMQAQMKDLGYDNVFIGTVDGEPEETALETVLENVEKSGYKKVVLRPLMVVAGDHANNDMAGDDPDSWQSKFEASGKFDSVECQIEGLGRIPEVQELYIAHTEAAIENPTSSEDPKEAAAATTSDGTLADGTYTADFNTDSDMFHVNEANDGKGTLTVKDGKMTIHISLVSKNIENLFLGTADDAIMEDAKLIEPTVDTVTYDDGTTEEVYGFDVPVPALDEEFDLAIIGTKGKWYDHKVSVTDPVPVEE